MIAGNHGDKVSKDWVKADRVSVRRATEDQYHPEVLAAIKRGEVDGGTVAAVQNQTGVKVGDKNQQQEVVEEKKKKAEGVASTQVPGAPGSLQDPGQEPSKPKVNIAPAGQEPPKPKSVLAAGTNDWDNEDKAYQGVKKSIQALIDRGEDPSLVLPAKSVNGKPHAYNGAKRAAEELGVDMHYPSSFGQGSDHYHITPSAADEIKTKYAGAKFYGDSNSVRLGAKEGETGFTGKGSDHIANQITASGQSQNQQASEIKRFSLASNKFEEPPKQDNSDPYQRKVQSPFATSPNTEEAIKKATESAKQAAEIPGPKKFNNETGKWEAYQLPEQPKYEKPKVMEATSTPSAPEGEPTRVSVLADGGEADTGSSSEISAYPIGSLKGDNAIVANADQEPLFTMNTDKENASYDSSSGKVSVEPVTKNNPDSLSSSSEGGQADTKSAESEQSGDKAQNESAMISGLKLEPNMSFQSATQLSSNPMTCPSFERAISAAGFKKSGSHNDDGATNLR